VLIKGGGLAELRGRDFLLQRQGPAGRWLEHAPVDTPHTHGSGCTLGAAITAGRARGLTLESAVVEAKLFVEGALRQALAIGGGQGPLCHWHRWG
jgi:hydroxymethylpyrimidine/phosphomethylpyrimidine kinase